MLSCGCDTTATLQMSSQKSSRASKNLGVAAAQVLICSDLFITILLSHDDYLMTIVSCSCSLLIKCPSLNYPIKDKSFFNFSSCSCSKVHNCMIVVMCGNACGN